MEMGFVVGGGGGHELHIKHPSVALWAGERPNKVRNAQSGLGQLYERHLVNLPPADDTRYVMGELDMGDAW